MKLLFILLICCRNIYVDSIFGDHKHIHTVQYSHTVMTCVGLGSSGLGISGELEVCRAMASLHLCINASCLKNFGLVDMFRTLELFINTCRADLKQPPPRSQSLIFKKTKYPSFIHFSFALKSRNNLCSILSETASAVGSYFVFMFFVFF